MIMAGLIEYNVSSEWTDVRMLVGERGAISGAIVVDVGVGDDGANTLDKDGWLDRVMV